MYDSYSGIKIEIFRINDNYHKTILIIVLPLPQLKKWNNEKFNPPIIFMGNWRIYHDYYIRTCYIGSNWSRYADDEF